MLGAVKFEVSSETIASPREIMDVLGNWQTLPQYWHGMREISESTGNMLLVRFAFPGEGKMSYICDSDSLSCTENYHSGPFTGFKRIDIEPDGSKTRILVRWEVHLSLRLLLLKGFILKHFRQGTESALSRIIEEAEKSIELSPEQAVF